MFDTKLSAPYSRCGDTSFGASSIIVTVYASSFAELEERFEYANTGDVWSEPVDEVNKKGRWCRRWTEARKTLADVINFPGWNRQRPKR